MAFSCAWQARLLPDAAGQGKTAASRAGSTGLVGVTETVTDWRFADGGCFGMAILLRHLIAGLALFSVWVIMLPLGVLRAFIIRDLWGWFLVPLGLPEISVLHAFGLGLFATLFVDQMLAVLIVGDDTKAAFRLFLQGIAGWLATWGLGAVVAYMM
jgi:hypothetical protein